jgi:hypothetical protein
LRSLRLIQTAVLIAVGLLCFFVAARAQQPEIAAANEVIHSWNEAISSIEPEDQKFRELFETYKRNPPGRVLLTPDVRTEQKKHRIRLINEIVASHEERIRSLRRLAKAEEASQ